MRLEELKKIWEVLQKKEAISPVVLDMRQTRVPADYFVIMTANSNTHMKALRDDLVDLLEEMNKKIIYFDRGEGYDWILIDASDIVIHIFTKSAREFYDLENLWVDATKVEM